MDDTKGRITVKGSQEKIQQLKNEIQIIVGGFGERSLTQSKFSLLKTDKGLSHARSLLSSENSTVEILVNDQGSVMMYDLDETNVQKAYKTLENAICDYKLPQSKSSISFISVLIFSWTDKTMYRVCSHSGNMARKQCFLVCPRSGNMARKQHFVLFPN